jgi:hypothetical protein
VVEDTLDLMEGVIEELLESSELGLEAGTGDE